MTAPSVPPYLSPGQIGRACGISRRSAMTELRGAGLLERRGPRWRVSESRLRERLPDIYDRVYAWFVLGDDAVGKRAGTGRNQPKRAESDRPPPHSR